MGIDMPLLDLKSNRMTKRKRAQINPVIRPRLPLSLAAKKPPPKADIAMITMAKANKLLSIKLVL